MQKSERIVRNTAAELDEMLARGEDLTDWDRLRTMTDEELEASIDWEDEGEFDLSNAFAGLPPELPQPTTFQFERDVVAWFRPRSSSFRRHISRVLRNHVDAQMLKRANERLSHLQPVG